MNILAVDPGPEKSGWVVLDDKGVPIKWGWDENAYIRRCFDDFDLYVFSRIEAVLIEYPKPRGMPTSKEEMDTLFEAGRLIQAWGGPWHPVYRQDVKLAMCGNVRANDSNIRQAIIDRFGGDAVAIGGKKCQTCHGTKLRGRGKKRGPCADCEGTGWESAPGPLHGIATHCWSALAVGLTYLEKHRGNGVN